MTAVRNLILSSVSTSPCKGNGFRLEQEEFREIRNSAHQLNESFPSGSKVKNANKYLASE